MERSPSFDLFSLIGMSHADLFEDRVRGDFLRPLTSDVIGYHFRSECEPSRILFLSYGHVYEALASGNADVHFDCDSPDRAFRRPVAPKLTLDEVPAHYRRVALWREQMVLQYQARCEQLKVQRLSFTKAVMGSELKTFHRNVATKSFFEDRSRDTPLIFQAPSVQTFKRWHDIYHANARNVVSLVPRYHRAMGPRSQGRAERRRRLTASTS